MKCENNLKKWSDTQPTEMTGIMWVGCHCPILWNRKNALRNKRSKKHLE